MVGTNHTFGHLEAGVLNHLDSLPALDASHLMYAYAIRDCGSDKLHEKFMQILSTEAKKMDYPALFNAVYYLMFRNCADEKIWHEVVDRASRIEEVMPLTYLRPFKFAAQYCSHHFPHWHEE